MAVYGIAWEYRIGGGQPDVRTYPEGDTETWNVYNNKLQGLVPVVYDVSEDGVVPVPQYGDDILGFALADASGTSDTEIPVMLVGPDDVFSCTISNAGANAAASHKLDNVGLVFGFLASTESGHTDKYTIDSADTTTTAALVIDRHPDDAWGTAGGRVLFRIPAVGLDKGSQS